MNACINKKSYEYRSLSERTGLPDLFLEAEIIDYADKHNGRWPTPAEIDGIFRAARKQYNRNI